MKISGVGNEFFARLSECRKDMLFFDGIRTVGGKAYTVFTCGDAVEINGRVSLGDGCYSLADEKPFDKSDITLAVDKLTVLNDYLSETGIPLLYVQTPQKISKTDKLPAGKNDCFNDNFDMLTDELRRANIDVLDLRDSFSEIIDYHGAFFKTDHHWTPETGLYSASLIAQTFEDEYAIGDFSLLFDENNFVKICFEDAMFGSDGENVGRGFADAEDFVLPVPDSDTDFTVTNPDIETERSGSFAEAIADCEKLREFKGGSYAYETLLGGTRPLTKIYNNARPDGIKLLVIEDSFGLACTPYLALGASEVDALDFRETNGNFNGNLCAYINEYKPDAVLIIANRIQTLTSIKFDASIN